MLIGVLPVLLEPRTTVPRGATLPRPAASDGPPTQSATRSYRPTAAAGSATTDDAPRASSSFSCSARATAVTWAPAAAASWIWIRPTPPLAPVTRTRRPSRSPASRSVRRAVRPARGRAAACSMPTSAGSGASRLVGTAASSAQPACSTSATTRVPAAGPDPSAACSMTTPAMSWPGRHWLVWVCSRSSSPRLIEKARTATSASPPPGRGSSTAVMAGPSGLLTIAFMVSSRSAEQAWTKDALVLCSGHRSLWMRGGVEIRQLTYGHPVPRRCSWQLLQPGAGEQVPGGSGRRICPYQVHQGGPGHLGGQRFPQLLQVCLLGLAAAGRVRPDPPPAHVSERSHPGHHRRDGNVQPGTARLILGVSCDEPLSGLRPGVPSAGR